MDEGRDTVWQAVYRENSLAHPCIVLCSFLLQRHLYGTKRARSCVLQRSQSLPKVGLRCCKVTVLPPPKSACAIGGQKRAAAKHRQNTAV
jgi:hypothetical protein